MLGHVDDSIVCVRGQMPGKKTTKLWVPDDEVSPETLAKVRTTVLAFHVCDNLPRLFAEFSLHLLHRSRD